MCPQCTPISVKIVNGRFVTVYPPAPVKPDDITFHQYLRTPHPYQTDPTFGIYGYIQGREDHA
jgi:hypothetical protein